MIDIFINLFSSDGFMPHGHCYLWTPSLVWIMLITDSLIFIAYSMISFTLYRLVKKIQLPFSAMFLAFGAFIAACGATHFMEVWTLWMPTYWLSALIKAITALASIATAIWLFPIFPKIISLSESIKANEAQRVALQLQSKETMQLESKFRGLLESAPDGIIVVDINGKIAIVNSQIEKLFGYTRDEILGQYIEILVPTKFKEVHAHYRNGYISHPTVRPMGAGRLLTGRKKDGTEFPVEISLSPLDTPQGTLITSIIRDVTERRKAEDQLQSSLREKESLLKEIHHRVKNNLQVTSSLLRLQSEHIKDEYARVLFIESQNRIRSMALVHEKLYRSSDLSQINFSDYVESLAQLLFRSFGVDSKLISFKITGEKVYLSIEYAVTCGLIINELLSNCFKHAFPEKNHGTISVTLERVNLHQILIQVADDGIGLPKNFDMLKTETLGLQLVETLVNQLNGTNTVTSNKSGTHFNISFYESNRCTHG